MCVVSSVTETNQVYPTNLNIFYQFPLPFWSCLSPVFICLIININTKPRSRSLDKPSYQATSIYCKQTQSKNIHKNIYSSPASFIPGLHFVCLYLAESPLTVWFLLMLNPTPPLQVSKSLLPTHCPSLWRPILSSSDATI